MVSFILMDEFGELVKCPCANVPMNVLLRQFSVLKWLLW